jgi:hypothetical protein
VETREDGLGLLRDVGDPQPSGRRSAKRSVEHADAHPERIDEWRATLVYLREFADKNGVLPESFDSLLSDIFEPIFELQGGRRS